MNTEETGNRESRGASVEVIMDKNDNTKFANSDVQVIVTDLEDDKNQTEDDDEEVQAMDLDCVDEELSPVQLELKNKVEEDLRKSEEFLQTWRAGGRKVDNVKVDDNLTIFRNKRLDIPSKIPQQIRPKLLPNSVSPTASSAVATPNISTNIIPRHQLILDSVSRNQPTTTKPAQSFVQHVLVPLSSVSVNKPYTFIPTPSHAVPANSSARLALSYGQSSTPVRPVRHSEPIQIRPVTPLTQVTTPISTNVQIQEASLRGPGITTNVRPLTQFVRDPVSGNWVFQVTTSNGIQQQAVSTASIASQQLRMAYQNMNTVVSPSVSAVVQPLRFNQILLPKVISLPVNPSKASDHNSSTIELYSVSPMPKDLPLPYQEPLASSEDDFCPKIVSVSSLHPGLTNNETVQQFSQHKGNNLTLQQLKQLIEMEPRQGSSVMLKRIAEKVSTQGSGNYLKNVTDVPPRETQNYQEVRTISETNKEFVRPNSGHHTSSLAAGPADNSVNKLASLGITPSCCLRQPIPKEELLAGIARLDNDVKVVVNLTPVKMVQWLMRRRLLLRNVKCKTHMEITAKGEKLGVPYKLGRYKSETLRKQVTGGYIWVSQCETSKFSVFAGSIFEDCTYPPVTLYKLMYHWVCQTSPENIVNWLNISSFYLKNFFALMRSVCIAAVHEFMPRLGGLGHHVEVGILTFDTMRAGSLRRLSILAALDLTRKDIRFRLLNKGLYAPDMQALERNEVELKKVLGPLRNWIAPESNLLTDNTLSNIALEEIGFRHVKRIDEEDPTSNTNLFAYLNTTIPKMFSSTLNTINNSLVQQFLDEVSWRKKWDNGTRDDTFNNLMEHLAEMTNWDTGESLLTRLNLISTCPFEDWSYTPPASDLKDVSSGGRQIPKLHLGGTVQSKEMGTAQTAPESSLIPSSVNPSPNRDAQPSDPRSSVPIKRKTVTLLRHLNLSDYYKSSEKTLDLVSYYYAESVSNLPAKFILQMFPDNLKCPMCSMFFANNKDIVGHILAHIKFMSTSKSTSGMKPCPYCFDDFRPELSLEFHINAEHKRTNSIIECFICQICFSSEKELTMHMWRNHAKHDMPYGCGICGFRTSLHWSAIDHFYESHASLAVILCPICLHVIPADSFTSLKVVVVHIQTHLMKRGRKCRKCALTFFNDQEFRKHITQKAHSEHGKEYSNATILTTPACLERVVKMADPPRIQQLNKHGPPVLKLPRRVLRPQNNRRKEAIISPLNTTEDCQPKVNTVSKLAKERPSTSQTYLASVVQPANLPRSVQPSLTLLPKSKGLTELYKSPVAPPPKSKDVTKVFMSPATILPKSKDVTKVFMSPATILPKSKDVTKVFMSPATILPKSKDVTKVLMSPATILPKSKDVTKVLMSPATILPKSKDVTKIDESPQPPKLTPQKPVTAHIEIPRDLESNEPALLPPILSPQKPLASEISPKDPLREKSGALNKNNRVWFTCDTSSAIEIIDYKLQESLCLECEGHPASPSHFPGVSMCIACRLLTCCRKTMKIHVTEVHPDLTIVEMKSGFKINEGIVYDEMYCRCGYHCIDGDVIASHLATCKKVSVFVDVPEEVKVDQELSPAETKQKRKYRKRRITFDKKGAELKKRKILI